MEGESKSSSTTTHVLIGMAIGALAIVVYDKIRAKPKTMNDTLAGLSVDLSQSIKQAADQGISAKELYDNLLKQEAAAPDSGKKKPTPDKTQL